MSTRSLHDVLNDLEVTAYADYRDFLAELYRRTRAAEGDQYSYESFAEDLGFSAINVMRLVVQRKRALATTSAQTIIKALRLRNESRKYFLAMVQHVNARSPHLREKFFRKMLAAKQASIVSHRDKNQLAFLSEWYHWVVLEMLRLNGADSDPNRLAEKMSLAVAPQRIRRSLALLEAIGLVRLVGATGTPQVTQDRQMLVPSDETSARLAMAQHHQSMIENAKQALAKLPSDLIEYNALTVSVSYESFTELRATCKHFCEQIMAIEAREQKRECVAQLNVNLFSLTKWKRSS